MKLFDAVDEGILLTNSDLILLDANKWVETQLRQERSQLQGKKLEDIFEELNVLLLKRRIKTALLLKEKTYFHYESMPYIFKMSPLGITASHLSVMYQNITIVPRNDDEVYVIIYDKTTEALSSLNEQKYLHHLQSLNTTLHEYVTTLDQSVMTITTDLSGTILSVSQAMCDTNGYTKSELIGKNPKLFRHPQTPSSFYESMWEQLQTCGFWEGEICNQTKNCDDYWVHSQINTRYEGKKAVGYIAILQNITDKKKVEELLVIDTLTQVYNRKKFTQIFHEWEKKNYCFILAIMDIDNFKTINDTYGHHIGDEVLIIIAQTVKNLLSEDILFARWGGEEFALLSQYSFEETVIILNKIQEQLAMLSFPHHQNVTLSIGVACRMFDEKEKDFFERTDHALYQAKKTGKNKIVCV